MRNFEGCQKAYSSLNLLFIGALTQSDLKIMNGNKSILKPFYEHIKMLVSPKRLFKLYFTSHLKCHISKKKNFK